MPTYTYTVNIERGEDGYYVVDVPALPGCFTQGDTFEEAVAMAEDAIRGYLELLQVKGEPIPVERHAGKKESIALRVALTPARA